MRALKTILLTLLFMGLAGAALIITLISMLFM